MNGVFQIPTIIRIESSNRFLSLLSSKHVFFSFASGESSFQSNRLTVFFLQHHRYLLKYSMQMKVSSGLLKMSMRAHSQHKQCRKPFVMRFFNSINNGKVRHIDSANNNNIRNVLWHVYDRRDVIFLNS